MSTTQSSFNSSDKQKGLRDPIWTFIGTVSAVIAIALSIYFFYAQRPKNELQVIVDTNTSLVNVSPEATGKFEVLYEGDPVGSAFLIELRFVNSGNQAILESDFNQNIAIDFDTKLKVIDYLVTKSEPENINLELTSNGKNTIEITPTLLNPEDTVYLRFIVVGQERQSNATFNVNARIKNIKQVVILDEASRLTRASNLGFSRAVITLLGGAFLVSLVLRTFDYLSRDKLRPKQRLSITLIILAVFLILMTILVTFFITSSLTTM